jgi:hypothetical protein
MRVRGVAICDVVRAVALSRWTLIFLGTTCTGQQISLPKHRREGHRHPDPPDCMGLGGGGGGLHHSRDGGMECLCVVRAVALLRWTLISKYHLHRPTYLTAQAKGEGRRHTDRPDCMGLGVCGGGGGGEGVRGLVYSREGAMGSRCDVVRAEQVKRGQCSCLSAACWGPVLEASSSDGPIWTEGGGHGFLL